MDDRGIDNPAFEEKSEVDGEKDVAEKPTENSPTSNAPLESPINQDKEGSCPPEPENGYFPGMENWVKASKYPVDVESGVAMDDDDEYVKRHPDDAEQGQVNDDDDDDDDDEDYGILTYIPNYTEFKKSFLSVVMRNEGRYLKLALSLLGLILYGAYFITALSIGHKDTENYWCDGEGFLVIITLIVGAGLVYFQIIKRFFRKPLQKHVLKPFFSFSSSLWEKLLIRITVYIVIVLAFIIFLIVDASHETERLMSLGGLVLLILLGFIFSKAPRKVNWRQVLWGMGLQFVLGLMILRWDVGRGVFACAGSKIQTFLAFTNDGSGFVFGYLAVGDNDKAVFAFQILSVILFFGFCVQILYYLGAMQWIVLKMGWLLQATVGTTACESVNAAANIFLGQSEAPLLIRPYLPIMTKSELHAVMTGGFATIAGSVLAAYISFGVSAAHLLSASVMSAPAALAYAKLFYPETGRSKTTAKNIIVPKSTESNLLHAAMNGVVTAVPLVANIAANLVAFIAFIHFFDAVFNWTCTLVGAEEGVCSLENVMGYVFMPLAYTMGVPWEDCEKVGQLIGTKTIVNEFVAYIDLGDMVKENQLSNRAQIIATYALCGFSNISSIGINLASMGGMAPERRGDLAKVAFRAMIAGSAACFMTACIAGMLISEEDIHSPVQIGNATNVTAI